jgi:hypothetical protein
VGALVLKSYAEWRCSLSNFINATSSLQQSVFIFLLPQAHLWSSCLKLTDTHVMLLPQKCADTVIPIEGTKYKNKMVSNSSFFMRIFEIQANIQEK